MNLDPDIELLGKGELGQRIAQAFEYKHQRDRGDMSQDEYLDLLEDLRKLDNIQLNADELNQQIRFQQLVDLLKNIPLN